MLLKLEMNFKHTLVTSTHAHTYPRHSIAIAHASLQFFFFHFLNGRNQLVKNMKYETIFFIISKCPRKSIDWMKFEIELNGIWEKSPITFQSLMWKSFFCFDFINKATYCGLYLCQQQQQHSCLVYLIYLCTRQCTRE